MWKGEQSESDNGFILVLESMDRVNLSPKQRVPVAPQNGGDCLPQYFLNCKISFQNEVDHNTVR